MDIAAIALAAVTTIGPAVLVGAIVQLFKHGFPEVKSERLPLLSLLTGVLLSFLVTAITNQPANGQTVASAVVLGLGWGLAASGGYDVVVKGLAIARSAGKLPRTAG